MGISDPCANARRHGCVGLQMAGVSSNPGIVRKKRGMPFIAANGLLVLMPAALNLAALASRQDFEQQGRKDQHGGPRPMMLASVAAFAQMQHSRPGKNMPMQQGHGRMGPGICTAN